MPNRDNCGEVCLDLIAECLVDKSVLAGAIRYALEQRDNLVRFIKDGCIETRHQLRRSQPSRQTFAGRANRRTVTLELGSICPRVMSMPSPGASTPPLTLNRLTSDG
jgi:hypothetical protein